MPFAQRYPDPFNPEEEIYTEWCKLCRENVKPDLWLTGHKHTAEIRPVGNPDDHFGQPCTCIIGAKPDFKENTFVSANITLSPGRATIVFADTEGNVERTEEISF